MDRFASYFALILLLMITTTGRAEPIVISSAGHTGSLVELFTSEGCSSCPPADRWLSSLKNDPRLWKTLIPIAFHVDYWDDLGWVDPFASAANTRRQKIYALENSMRTIYTPGFFVNGEEWRRWAGLRRLSLSEGAPLGELTVRLEDGQLSATLNSQDPDDTMVLTVAILGMGLSEKVTAGENVGERLHHDFVALAAQSVKMVPQGRQLTAEVPLQTRLKQPAPEYALAAWVTRAGSQKPIQAIGAQLPEGWQP